MKLDHTQLPRYSYLDSSRGIAALIVLLAHFQFTILPQLNESWILKTPLKIFIDGQAAVLYFFLLSGYVLTLAIRKNENLTILNYLKFIVRRILRIFPAFIFTLLLSYLILHFITTRTNSWLDRYWIEAPELISMLKQSLLIIRLPYGPALRLIPHDWTLTIEIAVSFLLPAIALTSRTNSLFVLFFIYFSCQFLGLDPFVFDFSLGVFIASNVQKIQNIWHRNNFKTIWIFTAIFLICGDYLFLKIDYLNFILLHHKIWGLAILLVVLISSNAIQRLLSIKPLEFLGRISYSFYLLHLIILLVMTVLFNGLSPSVFFIVYLTITLVVSTVTYFQIEKPFIKVSKLIFD